MDLVLSWAEKRRAAGIATPMLVPIVLVPPPPARPTRPRQRTVGADAAPLSAPPPVPPPVAAPVVHPVVPAVQEEPLPTPPVQTEPEEASPLVYLPTPPTREVIDARTKGVSHNEIKGDREAELIRRYQAGDRNAGEILLRAHHKLIAYYAQKYSFGPHDLSPEDILAEAQVGFLQGVQRFDPTSGFALNTYTIHWIRHAVQRSKVDTGNTIRVPVHVHDSAKKRDPNDRLALAKNAARRLSHLDAPIGDEDGATLGDILAGDDNPEEAFAAQEADRVAVETLRAALAGLPPRLADVLRRRADGQTHEEIGQAYGLSRERMRQIERLAQEQAKKAMLRLGYKP